MKFVSFSVILILSLMLSSYTPGGNRAVVSTQLPFTIELPETKHNTGLFYEWNLGKYGISKNAFDYAKKGFEYLKNAGKLVNNRLLTVIDFSKPSSQKRFFAIDMVKGTVEFCCLVAHGKNSGTLYAKDFSNEPDSYKSSLGFFITKGTYDGSNGYSLKLAGVERGFNDNAENRAIVMHGADYVSQQHVTDAGYLGRSYGCPAVPSDLSQKIINKIKGGSCLFIYSPDKKYLTGSKIINS